MKPYTRSVHSATAAIAAALALSATPLAAQSVDAPADTAPAVQPQPAEAAPPVVASPAPPVAVSPVPTLDIPAASAAPAASGAAASSDVQPAPAPSASATTTTMKSTAAKAPAPAPKTTTRTTVTRTSTVSHAAPAAAPVAANDEAVPAAATDPAADSALPPDTADAAPPIGADPQAVAPADQPRARGIGPIGVALLAGLALLILLAGFLFLRRRRAAARAKAVTTTTRSAGAPGTARTVEARTAPPSPVEPVAASEAAVMATPTVLKRRDPAPVRGALPSNGASVDLPATIPDSYEERSALLEKMVNAKPDKANPFTDRRARLHRARLIMQSLGVTFDREPRIDLSQYPNNWPELQRPYYNAA